MSNRCSLEGRRHIEKKLFIELSMKLQMIELHISELLRRQKNHLDKPYEKRSQKTIKMLADRITQMTRKRDDTISALYGTEERLNNIEEELKKNGRLVQLNARK